jgi:hypothetical protein
VRDAAAGERDGRDVALEQAHAVDEQRARVVQHAEALEQLDGRARARRDGDAAPAQPVGERAAALRHEVGLELALGDVDRHRQALAPCVLRRRAEERVRDRVRRVRRDAEAHEGRLARAQAADLLHELRHRRLALRGIGAEDLLEHDAAHPPFEHRVEGDAGVAGVGVGRDAGAQPLGDPLPRPVEQIVARQHGALRGRETEDPVAEAEPLEEAAHGGELEVAVRVDEPRHEERLAELVVLARRRAVARSDVRDAAVGVDGDGRVAHRRRGDGQDPLRVMVRHHPHPPGALGCS